MVRTTRDEYPRAAASARAGSEGDSGTTLPGGAPLGSAALTNGLAVGDGRVPFLRGGMTVDEPEMPLRLSGEVGVPVRVSSWCRLGVGVNLPSHGLLQALAGWNVG